MDYKTVLKFKTLTYGYSFYLTPCIVYLGTNLIKIDCALPLILTIRYNVMILHSHMSDNSKE